MLPQRLRARAGLGDVPRLTAVMPVHNVAPYLRETLRSVQRQRFADFELVVVDDGSDDDTADVVRRAARLDRRLRLVQQDNAGQSEARNRAVAMARGELLAFVDGDDLLPVDAWSTLVASLDASGSDFAVGAMERMDDTGRLSSTRRMVDNHAEAMTAARIERRPELLADVWLFNKVYRTRFWREQGLAFPAGMIYEDQPVLTRAFLAGTFDVLTETVYHYRVRADGTSSSPSRHTMRDLADRHATKLMALDAVRAHGSEHVTDVLLRHVLPVDMWEYFRACVHAEEEYWRLVREMTTRIWTADEVPFWVCDVPLQQRLMGFFVTRDRRRDLARLVELLDGGRFEPGCHPWTEEPGLPEELRRR